MAYVISASAILSTEQGPYEWGIRDCLTTARAIIDGVGGRRYASRYGRAIGRWHRMSETRAMARIRKEFGGVGSAHAEGFGARPRWYGVDVLPGDTPREPGDIVQLGGHVSVMGQAWDTATRGDLIGFVVDGCEVWHWSLTGLAMVDDGYEIRRLFRCRR